MTGPATLLMILAGAPSALLTMGALQDCSREQRMAMAVRRYIFII